MSHADLASRWTPEAESWLPASPAAAVSADLAGVAAAAEAAALDLEPIGLSDIGKAALLDRLDTKYLLPAYLLAGLLERCGADYRVLEVGASPLQSYRTRYYDTPRLSCYEAHHTGRLPRFKVRVRTYVSTGARFLEVKRKTNRGRTLKHRLSAETEADQRRRLAAHDPLGLSSAVPVGLLRPVLDIACVRITLVGRAAPERVTLDLLLAYTQDTRQARFPSLVIAEVKQRGRSRSAFRELMRSLGRREAHVSKYCLGIATLVPQARRNRFLPLLHDIRKTMGMQ